MRRSRTWSWILGLAVLLAYAPPAGAEPPPPMAAGICAVAASATSSETADRCKAEREESRLIMTAPDACNPGALTGLTDDRLDEAAEEQHANLVRILEIAADFSKTPSTVAQGANAQAFIAKVDLKARSCVAKEKACRASAKCAGARAAKQAAKDAEDEFFNTVAQPMCALDQAREEALASIAHERANPSGYVDTNVLHDLGSEVQDNREQLAARGPEYVKVRHHPWRGWRSECTAP